MAGEFVKITDIVFDGTTNRGYIYDIPQIYEELWIVWSCRSARAAADIDQIQIRFNLENSADNASQIGKNFLTSGGSATRSSSTYYNAGAGFYGFGIASDNMMANLYGHGIWKIWNYNKAIEYKVGNGIAWTINNSQNSLNMFLQEHGTTWQSVEPIRDIGINVLSGNNFKANSSFVLYGVGRAA